MIFQKLRNVIYYVKINFYYMLKGFSKHICFKNIKRTIHNKTFQYNEMPFNTPLSVHSWVRFYSLARARCTFKKNKRFHSAGATATARNLSIFAMANVCISRARSSWEPQTRQTWSSRAIFLMLFSGVDFGSFFIRF